MLEGSRSENSRHARLVVLIAVTYVALVGFLLLPAVKDDYVAQGLWASLCRAAGVPSTWGRASTTETAAPATQVVLDRSMASPVRQDVLGRGATLALNCTMCHGPKGISTSEVPNLAGQHREVLIKQLHDFKDGQRASPARAAIVALFAIFFMTLPALP